MCFWIFVLGSNLPQVTPFLTTHKVQYMFPYRASVKQSGLQHHCIRFRFWNYLIFFIIFTLIFTWSILESGQIRLFLQFFYVFWTRANKNLLQSLLVAFYISKFIKQNDLSDLKVRKFCYCSMHLSYRDVIKKCKNLMPVKLFKTLIMEEE